MKPIIFQIIPNYSVSTYEPMLDSTINLRELREGLMILKPGKSPGAEGVFVEYLKIFGLKFEAIVLTSINNIFSAHIYPSKWALNFLKPIYKKGDRFYPDKRPRYWICIC